MCALPAGKLARQIADRELSAVEALEAHLARIEQRNPDLNAVVSLDAEAARKQAEAADAALAAGLVRGPLHGVPLTLKDGNDVAGLRTTLGTERSIASLRGWRRRGAAPGRRRDHHWSHERGAVSGGLSERESHSSAAHRIRGTSSERLAGRAVARRRRSPRE